MEEKRHRFTRLAGVVVVAALVVSACSGGGGGSASPGAAASAGASTAASVPCQAPATAPTAEKLGGEVSIYGTWTGAEQDSFLCMVKPWSDATGTKVKIDHYGKDRDGISVGSLDELAFAYEKKYGATGVLPEPGKPQGYEETGSVSSAIPGVGFSAKSSNAPNHTYEMEQDALGPVGHQGFAVDAQAMAALLFDFATHAEYRAMVKREFQTIKSLHDEYLAALRKVYVVPKVGEP